MDARTYPLTGKRCVRRIYSDIAIIDLPATRGVTVIETFGVSVADLQRRLGVELRFQGIDTDLTATAP